MHTHVYKNIKYVTCFFPSSTTRRLLRAKRTDVLSFSSIASLPLFRRPIPVSTALPLSSTPLRASSSPDQVKAHENKNPTIRTHFPLLIGECFEILPSSLTIPALRGHRFNRATFIHNRWMVMFYRKDRCWPIGNELMCSTITICTIFTSPIDSSILYFVLDVTIPTKYQTWFMSFRLNNSIGLRRITIDLSSHGFRLSVARKKFSFHVPIEFLRLFALMRLIEWLMWAYWQYVNYSTKQTLPLIGPANAYMEWEQLFSFSLRFSSSFFLILLCVRTFL